MITIVLVAAVLCALALIATSRPERRKQYNEFRRPAAAASGLAVYGDTGADGMSGGDMGGGCGGDGGGGGC